MNLKGLKFLLVGGQFLQVIVTEQEARDTVRMWSERQYQVKDQLVIRGDNQFGCWAVLVEDIRAVHTMDVQAQPGPIPGQPLSGFVPPQQRAW